MFKLGTYRGTGKSTSFHKNIRRLVNVVLVFFATLLVTFFFLFIDKSAEPLISVLVITFGVYLFRFVAFERMYYSDDELLKMNLADDKGELHKKSIFGPARDKRSFINMITFLVAALVFATGFNLLCFALLGIPLPWIAGGVASIGLGLLCFVSGLLALWAHRFAYR